MKRLLSLLTLAFMLVGILSACGSQPPAAAPTAPAAAATTAPAATSAPAPTTAAAATTAPTTAAAATTAPAPTAAGAATAAPAPGGMTGTIKVATQSPLSGEQASLGTGIKNGAELGLEQLGKTLTDMGFTVELAPFDDQAKPEVGSANAKNIASDPDILCLVGHLNSGVALAALPDYQNAKLVMVSPANTNPRITESGYTNAFRVVGRDDLQGPIGARFANETLKAKKVYVLHDKTDYGQGLAEFFQKEAKSLGMTVSGFEGTEEKAVFDSIITPIQAANPDLIYFGGIYSQIGPFIKQLRDKGITAPVLGGDGMDAPDLAKLAGETLTPTYYTTVAAPVSQFPDAAKFATDYKAAYNGDATPFAAQSYDSMGVCVTAIANAAKTANGKPTREQVLAEMAKLEPYKGITGTYKFNAKGDTDPATYYIFEANTDPAKWNDNKLSSRIESAPPSGQ